VTLQEELEAEAKNILLLPHPCLKFLKYIYTYSIGSLTIVN